ncbi:MAG: glycosyltransferase family 4 protein [Thermodesulfobacteriota bacterium]
MRIMHLMHRSVPGTHGYAIRSRQIVVSQRKNGLEPLVITSPSQAPLGPLDEEKSEFIDGIRYFRTGGRILPGTKDVKDGSSLKASFRILQNVSLLKAALRVARMHRPEVIHAHSPFTCGLVGDMVGRWTGLPTVYEVRGIWEASHVARHSMAEHSLSYRGIHLLETAALRRADMCCVISEALRGEVASRGISPEKIFIVPNGVDIETFVPGVPSQDLVRRAGLEGALVAGYIGSFFYYEGLDLLVQAAARLKERFPALRLLLVGDGEHEAELRKMTIDLGVCDRVVFTGRVPHEDIMDYYRACDLLILPRREGIETRLVTPLKPLEIMAMQKPVLASDIGGHREIVTDGLNGILFRSEDLDDLVAKWGRLLEDKGLRKDLGIKARRWVEENRDWGVLVNRYVDQYTRLVAAQR